MRVSRPLVAATLVAIGLPVLAAADLLLDGSEFQVNTYTTAAQVGSRARSVAAAADGSFVVVWYSSDGQDGDESSVRAQRFDSGGAAVGTEFQVNSYTTNYQDTAAVATAANGSFVVAWTSAGASSYYYGQYNGQDGSRSGVFAQRYDSAGAPDGSEFRVNSEKRGFQSGPAVAAAADGNFIVVWTSVGGRNDPNQDGSGSGVFAQRYDSAGAPDGSEFQVNSQTGGAQEYPLVAAASAGGFVVVWRSFGWDGQYFGVFGQRYDGSGAAAGSEFQVNSYTTDDQYAPALAVAADGGFVVVWTSVSHSLDGPNQDGDGAGVFGQRYDSAGARAGTEFQVNSYTTHSQAAAAVTATTDGGFVVMWTSELQDGSVNGVYAQRYDATGTPTGTEFQVNSYTTSSQSVPAVAAVGDGGVVAVWNSDGQDGDVYGMFGQLLCVDDNGNAICDGQETARSCGDTADGEGITATDGLFVLRAAVGLSTCLSCVCDTDGSGSIAASDALRVLFAATEQNVALLCPPCA